MDDEDRPAEGQSPKRAETAAERQTRIIDQIGAAFLSVLLGGLAVLFASTFMPNPGRKSWFLVLLFLFAVWAIWNLLVRRASDDENQAPSRVEELFTWIFRR